MFRREHQNPKNNVLVVEHQVDDTGKYIFTEELVDRDSLSPIEQEMVDRVFGLINRQFGIG